MPAALDPAELSAAGFFVETPQPAPLDSELDVFLRIGEARFEATGHVVKSVNCDAASRLGKRPGYALLLANLDDAQRRRLASAIEQLARSSRRGAQQPSEPVRAAVPQPERAAAGPSRPRTAAPPSPVRHAPNPPPTRAPLPPSAATTTSARVDPEEAKVLSQLTRELQEQAGKPPWTLLGVSQGAESAEITAAFHRAAKAYHPHQYARYAHPEIKRTVTELFIAYKRAYTSLLKSSRGSRP